MNILLEKLKSLEKFEEIANNAQADYEKELENADYEAAFDIAYKNEFDAFVSLAKYIEYITSGEIDFLTAKKIIKTKRSELLSILSA